MAFVAASVGQSAVHWIGLFGHCRRRWPRLNANVYVQLMMPSFVSCVVSLSLCVYACCVRVCVCECG